MTIRAKSILVAPLFPFWIALILLVVLIATIIEIVDWIKFWLWPEVIKEIWMEQWDNFRMRLGIISYDDIREGGWWGIEDPNSRYYDPQKAKSNRIESERFELARKRSWATQEMADAWIRTKEIEKQRAADAH